MNVLKVANLHEFKDLSDPLYKMRIAERAVPEGAEAFFEKLMAAPLQITAKIRQTHRSSDISAAIDAALNEDLKATPFYETWVSDINDIIEEYFNLQSIDAVLLHIGSQRGCRRYHVDQVDHRLVVTYSGTGTEWLPNDAINRQAYEDGQDNDQIILDPSARQFLNPWDVAIFRGGSDGILHRTPDDALDRASIFMRIDPYSFWENIL